MTLRLVRYLAASNGASFLVMLISSNRGGDHVAYRLQPIMGRIKSANARERETIRTALLDFRRRRQTSLTIAATAVRSDVRFRVQSGQHLLILSFSASDPKRTLNGYGGCSCRWHSRLRYCAVRATPRPC